jgi:hypothetical protein
VSLLEGCESSQHDLIGVAGNHLCLDLLDLDGEAIGSAAAFPVRRDRSTSC